MAVTIFQGSFKRGEVIGERYRILKKLGEGGAGSVYHCRDMRNEADVAIKTLSDPGDAKRFRREAQVMRAVRSPHVLRLLNVGKHQGQVLFLVLEYMRGGSLREYMDKKGRLSAQEAAWIAIQALRGLRAARTVHRDLKPENLLIANPEGQRGVRFVPSDTSDASVIKVADFGLAKPLQGSNETSLTRSAAVMGTPTYMSPEQCRSTKNVGVRTDIYALGCILVEMVSGSPPYDASNVYDIMAKHCSPDVAPQLGRMPASLRSVVQRCLEKAAGKRYRSLRALEDDLAPIAGVRSSDSAGCGCLGFLALALLLFVLLALVLWYTGVLSGYWPQIQEWWQ